MGVGANLTRLVRRVSVLTLAGVSVAAGVPQDSLENDVKAAFLYNFTKFIEWPSLPLAAEPFRICVVGDRAFARAVDRTIDGEAVQGHRLVRTDPQTPQEARGCAILYVGAGDIGRGTNLAATLQQSPTLVVTDGPRAGPQGAAIAFVVENNRVRFDINTSATDRAGLKVSSKLLRVARNVTPGGTIR